MLNQRGSAVVESIFALAFTMVLALAAIQVAYALYARNVVMSSAHEAARAALEHGRSTAEAQEIARRVLLHAAGGVIDEPHVSVLRRRRGSSLAIAVEVRALVRNLGPVPYVLPVRVRTAASGEFAVP